MNKQTPSLTAEADAVRRWYSALNSNDASAMIEIFDPQVVRTEPEEFGAGGPLLGIAAVKAHHAKARDSWAEGSCKPQRFLVAGDKVIVFVEVRVRLKHETDWRQGNVVDVFMFRNGKAVEFRTFVDEQQALQWAGVNGQQADST